MTGGWDPDTPGWGWAAAALVVVAACFVWLAFGK